MPQTLRVSALNSMEMSQQPVLACTHTHIHTLWTISFQREDLREKRQTSGGKLPLKLADSRDTVPQRKRAGETEVRQKEAKRKKIFPLLHGVRCPGDI